MGYRKEKKEDRDPDPILTLQNARLKAKKVMEMGATEKYAPQVSILWKIIDDGAEGDHNDKTFLDGFRFSRPQNGKEGADDWVILSNTRFGGLAQFVAYDYHDGADYFDSDVEIDFEVDLDGAEVIASLEPKRFKPSDAPTGTRTVAGSMQSIERARKRASKILVPDRDDPEVDEEEFEDIPF